MHIRYQNSLLILLVMGYVLLGSNSLFSMKPDDFEKEASIHLPLREEPYTYTELMSKLKSLLHKEIKKEFQALSIMFKDDFPPPPHSNETIVRGWQCLYRKCAFGQTIKDEKEKKKVQLDALYQLLRFHKKKIAKFDSALAEKIPEFDCPRCKQSARKDLGLEHTGYK